MFPAVVETDRLRLEGPPSERVDLLELYRVCSSDPAIDEVTRHVPWSPHATPKETKEFLDEAADSWEAGDGAVYAVRPRDGEAGAGELAGMTGLHPDWDRRTAGMGIWLRKRFWGRGYAGERAGALFYLAFERLDLDAVAVECAVDNDRSRRAVERYVEAHGGRFEGRLRNRLPVGDEVRDARRYSVSREEWAANAVRDAVAVRE